MRTTIFTALLLGVVAAACGGDGAPGPDLEIERRTGYVVAIDRSGSSLLIGFNAEPDALTGDALDVTDAVWRVDDGPFTEPPATCVTEGGNVEVGITKVQRSASPGLLEERVVWLACLSSES